jgi:regulator of chromosome condensation
MNVMNTINSVNASPLKRKSIDTSFELAEHTLVDNFPIHQQSKHKRRKLQITNLDRELGVDAILHLQRQSVLGNLTQGSVAVLGDNTSGQLGMLDLDAVDRPKLLKVPDSVQVVAGGMSSYSITLDGTVYSWGCNDDGALGRDVDDVDQETLPAPVVGLQMSPNDAQYKPQHRWNGKSAEWIGRVVQFVAGDSIAVALCENGKVYACGTFRNQNGLYGFSNNNTPIKPKNEAEEEDVRIKKSGRQYSFVPVSFDLDGIKMESRIMQIAAGANHCLALDEWGRVFSWGCGEVGVLGRRVYLSVEPQVQTLPDGEDLKPDRKLSLTPGLVDVPTAFGVFAGGYHSIILTEQGPFTFGLNNWGQLGIASLDANHLLYPHAVKLDDVVAAGGGEHFSVFQTVHGKLFVCGNNESQQLGRKIDPNKAPTKRTMTTVSPEGIKHVSHHSVVLQCFEKPTLLSFSQPFDRVWCGNNYVFAQTTSGDLVRWGAGHLNLLFQQDEEDVLPSIVEKSALKRRVLDVGTGGQHVLLLLQPNQ